MTDETGIKFRCEWRQSPLPSGYDPSDLLQLRDQVYRTGLLGYDEAGKVGFGNVSQRFKSNEFIITGTESGKIKSLQEDNLAWVKFCNTEENSLIAGGPAMPSSESLTHGWFYSEAAGCHIVIHIHSAPLWEHYINRLPTTDRDIPYGTPGMAFDIGRLFREQEIKELKAMVMGGHKDGLICFGASPEEAYQTLQRLCSRTLMA